MKEILFPKKPPDIEIILSEEEKKRLLDQLEMQKKPPDKPWYLKKKCENCSELFYKRFILKMKGVSLRKSLMEGNRNPNTDCLVGWLWSMKKVFCALLMMHEVIRRSRSLKFYEVSLKLMDGTGNLFIAGTISSSLERGL
jgi:hypothetical protein